MIRSNLLAFSLLLLAACGNAGGGSSTETAVDTDQVTTGGDILTVKVGPQKVSCIGVVPQECLVVNDEFFYDEINGFNFESGFSYVLKIRKSNAFPEGVQAPADASIYVYDLVEVVEKK